MSTSSIAIIFFLVTNPIGNAPAILALIKDFSFQDQRRILLREVIAAFFIAVFFQIFGEIIFGNILQVKPYTTNITAGILLFLVAVQMIFPSAHPQMEKTEKKEPFIVPIATPLLSGPGLLTIIMLKSGQEQNNLKIFIAIILAWIGVAIVLLFAPYLQKILKRRGMMALEQLMGLVLTMMAVEMIIKGVWIYREGIA